MTGTECKIGITFNPDLCHATDFDNFPPRAKEEIVYFLKVCYLWLQKEMHVQCVDMAGAEISILESSRDCHLAWFHIKSEGLKYKNNREIIAEHLRCLFNETLVDMIKAPIFLSFFYEGEKEDQYL
jgi:hypothetical protein